jgi:uncharacterized membrane protein YhaH (DUF805 family)
MIKSKFFRSPWLELIIILTVMGALTLVKAKVTVVRFILIGIMVFTSFGLIRGACETQFYPP